MKPKPKPSPVHQLLTLVWNSTPSPPWERLNHSMSGAMKLAINAGFSFASDDFKNAMKEFRGGYWFDSEGFYALAIHAGNLSAIKAFEAWKKRSPFIADGVVPGKRGRLAVGSQFLWQGQWITVTSFSEDSSHLTACSYHKRWAKNIAKRFPITVADIREERATKRERQRLRDRVRKVVGDGSLPLTMERRLKRLGIASKTDWFAAPIDTLRDFVKELEGKEKPN